MIKMTMIHKEKRPAGQAALRAVAALALLALAAGHVAQARAGRVAPATPAAAADCRGNACAQVTLTFDEAKQQYRAQNNSERAVVVEGENLVASARVRVAAGRTEYLPLNSLAGSYRANYE